LVYPKQEIRFRRLILEALVRNTSAETGIGYNVLFDKVKDEIKSKATFESYLSDLEHDGIVHKESDPRHKKGVVIYKNPKASDLELLTIQMLEDIFSLFDRSDSDRRKTIKPMMYDEGIFGEIDRPSRWNLEAVANCLSLTQKTLTKMLPKIKDLYGEAPFIKTVEKDKRIYLQFTPTKVNNARKRDH